MWAFGKILYDPSGIVHTLQQSALKLWQSGPAPFPTSISWLPRYSISGRLRDLDDVISNPGDSATIKMLIVGIVTDLVKLHCQLSGQWREKDKRILQDLEEWDARAAR